MSVPDHRGRLGRGRWLAAVVVVALAAGRLRSSGRSSSSGDVGLDRDDRRHQRELLRHPRQPVRSRRTAPPRPPAPPTQGVTDRSITIGYGDDAGYQASPGLDHEMSDAVKGMIEWCNDQGGINGRTVDGVYYDAKITEANNVMAEACTEGLHARR